MDTTSKNKTMPLMVRYLYYLLYNTSLEYNSYTTFYSAFFYTVMYLENYNSELVSTQPLASCYYCTWQQCDV